MNKKYWFGIFLALLGIVVGFFAGETYYYGDYTEIKQQLEICNSSITDSLIDSPGASWSKDDKSTTVNVDGPVTTSSLSIGAGGQLNIGSGSSVVLPQGVSNPYNVLFTNVLVNTSFGQAFIKYFPPGTWIYFGLCNDDLTNCMIIPNLQYNNEVELCNIIHFESGGNTTLEFLPCGQS